MATLFEAVLVGGHEDLEAIAEAALDEITRVERLLSRFDPRSEISRINREAFDHDVLVDRELAALFDHIDRAWHDTAGASSKSRTMRFRKPGIRLDGGGLGKGYALDRAAEILAEYSIERFFLHGGTSSGVARGVAPEGQPWRIRFGERDIELSDTSFSCSETSHSGEPSDIVVASSGGKVVDQRSVAVLGPSGLQCEILSTACVVLGPERSESLLARCGAEGYRVVWDQEKQ
jgi:thiamine biosynthesis lipoprotein